MRVIGFVPADRVLHYVAALGTTAQTLTVQEFYKVSYCHRCLLEWSTRSDLRLSRFLLIRP